jgi:hypothetical protein
MTEENDENTGNKGALVIISEKTQPTAQISIAGVYVGVPSNSSGARYHNVTTT